MTLHYTDPWLTVHLGDCRAVMAEMEAESVHCVVTSPPYWGLRDYGTASWTGGDDGCDHSPARRPIGNSPSSKSTLTTNNGRGPQPGDKFSPGSQSGYANLCPCGAHRVDQQLGLEPTPEAYVEAMVAVFREVRRVLRSDGTVWLNLGDSYAGSGKGGNPEGSPWSGFVGNKDRETSAKAAPPIVPAGLKPKDLVGIPWRVAFALQADGWYLRSDIIWAKPNPMPESVTDRPTKSHEYLFLLTKSARYFFDGEAVRLPISPYNQGIVSVAPHGDHVLENGHRKNETRTYETIKGANIRTVWTVATQPYPGAHFATFPPKLIEPCIKAGCPDKVCVECGAPWERVDAGASTFDESRPQGRRARVLWAQHGFTPEHLDAVRAVGITDTGKATVTQNGTGRNDPEVRRLAAQVKWAMRGYYREVLLVKRLTTFAPACKCDSGGPLALSGPRSEPGTVLDPFAGSGTTAMVANRLSRRAVLIDLNADYLGQVMDRNRALPLGLETA